MVRSPERPDNLFVVARTALFAVAAALLGYLAAIAAWPEIRDALPVSLRWFGAPNSAVTIGVVVVALALVIAVVTRTAGGRRSGAPVAIVAGLAVTTTLLGMASYWRCQDESHPDFFTPLLWTASVVKGGDPTRALTDGPCPVPMPVALHVAQISALAAVFMSVVGVAVALFRSRFDRLRVRSARSVTAVVGVDHDAQALIAVIAHTLRRRSILVVVTDAADSEAVHRARTVGARILTVDLDQPEALVGVPIWHKLDRLYLLAPDPSTNLLRLRTLTALGGSDRRRIPLIVRIDDPWQASAWRAQHFGGVHNRWAADTVGIYEVTARRLLDRILAGPVIDRLLVCGSSQLTTALCSDMFQRRLEHEYAGAGWLPALVVVAENASEYQRDSEFAAAQLGYPDRSGDIIAIDEEPSFPSLMDLVSKGDPRSTALVLVDSGVDGSAATRIAARWPQTTIHVYDPRANPTRDRVAVVGRLYTYRLSLDLPGGQAHDAWERAATLIHNRYVADSRGAGPTAVPWAELDEFYRESNRRQVRNALWMVEKIGGHTWNSWGQPPNGVHTAGLRGLEPLEQLQQMGFDAATATAMARAEHEDWCRYYRKHGWRSGPHRDDTAKVHDKLLDWSQIESDPQRLNSALRSLAATLTKLRELGYRSRPADDETWVPYRRSGVVLARQRSSPWTWTAHDGSTMRADSGDWAVSEQSGGKTWSVRDDIFRATHQHLGGGRWRRLGTVLARPAHAAEKVDTLEGTITAPDGSWIVQGDHGDVWAVPGDEFSRRYEPTGQDGSKAAGK